MAFPAARAALPEPAISTEQLAQIYEIQGLSTRWVTQPAAELSDAYNLQLEAVATLGELPATGSMLVVVALVGSDLHVRIFDATGTTAVDAPEAQLTPGQALNELKGYLQMSPFPDDQNLQPGEKEAVFTRVTATTGYPPAATGPTVESITNPSFGQESTLTYQQAGFFDLSSRAGHAAGIGISAESQLPPIDIFAAEQKIRTNAQVVARTVRHYSVSVPGGGDIPMDLLVALDGNIGYDLGPGGDPYAFERILSAEITLNIRIHRLSGAVATVWSGGAVMQRFNDSEVPFNVYGDLEARHWKVSGTEAAIFMQEYVEDRYTVADGESFAVEFELVSSTRNYEHPNATAFVHMLNTADFRLIPRRDGAVVTVDAEPLDEVPMTPLTNYAESNLRVGNHLVSQAYRPPALFPTVANSASRTVDLPLGQAYLEGSDVATVFHNAPGGQVGAALRATFARLRETPIGEEFSVRADADPFIKATYVPVIEGTLIQPIDIDYRIVFDGVIEFRCSSPEAYATALEMSEAKVEAGIWVLVHTRHSYRMTGEGGEYTFDELVSNPGSTPILNESGETIGVRLDINTIDTLEDVFLIEEGDYVEASFQLNLGINVNSGEAAWFDSIDLDFSRTFIPVLETDTAGASLVLVDPPGALAPERGLQLDRVGPDELALSWPSGSPDMLEESASLLPGSWVPVSEAAQDSGLFKTLFVPDDGGKRFFRLAPSP